jgi:HSP20 family molecular chaperone IbpA
MKTMISSLLIASLMTPALAKKDKNVAHENNKMTESAKNMERFSTITHDMETEFKRLEAEMHSALEKFSTKLHSLRGKIYAPRIEIKESPKEYQIKAEAPGMLIDDIKVVVKKNDLLITGTRESEIKRTNELTTSSEFHYGNFERLIHLEKSVDPKSVKTEYKNGILNIHVLKL